MIINYFNRPPSIEEHARPHAGVVRGKPDLGWSTENEHEHYRLRVPGKHRLFYLFFIKYIILGSIEKKHKVTNVIVNHLIIHFFSFQKSLPPNTLGRVCADYNEKHHISPDSRDEVHFVDDPDLAYVMQRYRLIPSFLFFYSFIFQS